MFELDDRAVRGVRWLEFQNNAGSTVPPYGILRVTGTTIHNNRQVLTVDQPNTFGSQYLHYINGPAQVSAGQYGFCTAGFPFPAAYTTGDGTPAFGDAWGPQNGTWLLKKNTGGFRVVGIPDTTNGIVLVERDPMNHFYGKNAGSQIAKGSTGTINIFTGTFNGETDSSITMTGVLARFGAIAANAMVEVFTSNNNPAASGPNWFAVETDTCPA